MELTGGCKNGNIVILFCITLNKINLSTCSGGKKKKKRTIQNSVSLV